MLKFISEILLCFYPCFSRQAAFEWFVVIIAGFMVRADTLGVTSIIRALALKPSLYHCLGHFFHADSWKWDTVFEAWAKTAAAKAPLKRISGRTLLIGDGVKQAKDGKYMPCTKKMVQESEDASKPDFIHGHFFGAVGVLAGTAAKCFCLPLSVRVHDGNQAVSEWDGEEHVSHVVQMLRDGFRAAEYFGRSLFVLDRYFLTVPMLKEWKAESSAHPGLLHVITRAKKNCTAYEQPGEYKGRGRRPLRGAAVHLKELFGAEAGSFRSSELEIYGKKKQVRFLSRTYLWGQGLYQTLQFVLAEYDGRQVILVSTDLAMAAEDIITSYAYRFKIEAMFRELKQQAGGFCYHFWTKAAPRLGRYRRKGDADPLLGVEDGNERQRIRKALKATEGYVLFSSIAMGIIQMLCLEYGTGIRVSDYRYLRTPSGQVMSEASMMEYLRRNLFRFLAGKDNLTITKIITSRQIPIEEDEFDRLAS